MEISDEFEEIGVSIAENGVIPPLKDMPRFAVPAVVVLAIGRLEGLHRAGQRLGAGLQQEMHVIPHQDIRVQCDPISATIAFEPVEIRDVIGLVMEDGGALVAADDDMKEGTWKIEAWFTSHAGESRTRAAISQYSGLTPHWEEAAALHALIDA